MSAAGGRGGPSPLVTAEVVAAPKRISPRTESLPSDVACSSMRKRITARAFGGQRLPAGQR